MPRIINDDQIGQEQFEIEHIGNWKQDLTRQKTFGGSEHLATIKDAEFILRFADFPSSQGALLFAQEVIPELS